LNLSKYSLQPYLLDIQTLGYVVTFPDRYRHVVVDVVAAGFLSRLNERNLFSLDIYSLNEEINGFCIDIAKDLNIDKDVCIKYLNDEILSRSLREAFLGFGKFKRRFRNPNWIEIINSFEYIDIDKFEKARKGLIQYDRPVACALVPTFRCHLKCVYCYAVKLNESPKVSKYEYELDVNQWKDIALKLVKAGIKHVVITGGEPLLRSDVVKSIAEIFYSNNVWVEFSTKYALAKMDPNSLKSIVQNVDKVQVSIDSLNPKLQGMLAGIDVDCDLLSNVSLLSKYSIRLQTNTVVTKYNLHELPDLIEELLNHNVDVIAVAVYMSSVTHVKNDLVPSKTACEETLREIISKLKKSHELELVDDQLQEYVVDGKARLWLIGLKLRSLMENDPLSFVRDYVCGAFRNSITILPNVDITGCDRMAHFSELVVGNIVAEKDLIDIWRRAEVLIPKRKYYNGWPCQTCRYFDECAPRFCYVEAMVKYRKPFAPLVYGCKLQSGCTR